MAGLRAFHVSNGIRACHAIPNFELHLITLQRYIRCNQLTVFIVFNNITWRTYFLRRFFSLQYHFLSGRQAGWC